MNNIKSPNLVPLEKVYDLDSLTKFYKNLYYILLENQFQIIETQEQYSVLKTPCQNEITIKYKIYGRPSENKFEVAFYLHLFDVEFEKNKNYIDNNIFNKHKLFRIISHTNNTKNLLDQISNHLKNFSIVQKITPFLDYIAINNIFYNFTSYYYYITMYVKDQKEFQFFQSVYKFLFKDIHYFWDQKSNLLFDNYSSAPIRIEPKHYSKHKILESQSYFEEFIKNNAEISKTYSEIKL